MKPIEMNDIARIRFLSALRFSPDGKRAAFAVSEGDEAENLYRSCLWLWEDGEVRQLTALGKERSFVWLDSSRILFSAVRSDDEKKRAEAGEIFTAYYCLDLRGGEALKAFELPFAASELRVIDETHFAVVGSVDRRAPELWSADEETRREHAKTLAGEKDYEVFEELPFWWNGGGPVRSMRSVLFLVSTEPMEIRAVTGCDESVKAMTVLGDELFVLSGDWDVRLPESGVILRGVNTRTGEVREVLRDEKMDASALSAVGDRLVLLGSYGERYGINENGWFYSVDPKTGEMRVLRREECSSGNSVGSDCRLGGGQSFVGKDGALYHLGTRGGSSYLFRLDADGEDTPVIDAEGSVDSFDISGDGILLVGLYGMQPQELYLYNTKTRELTQQSHFNADVLADKYVATPEPLTIVSEGVTVEGWVLKPIDFEEGRKYPAILDIHGGPKTVFGPVFFHEMQYWAGQGYFVFFCNPKGGDTFDNDFADIRGHYGDTDFRNLMDFTDAVLGAYPQIDGGRVCVTGGSYGGFMTNWIIGHTDRFRAAASQRSISNWTSFYGVADIGFYFAKDQTRGDIWQDFDRLWAQSPLKYADRVRTPTLFIHSDQDYRCPLDQGLQMLTALLDHGVPARMCLFHGENHELSRSGKPQHRIRRLREITEWFARYATENSPR